MLRAQKAQHLRRAVRDRAVARSRERVAGGERVSTASVKQNAAAKASVAEARWRWWWWWCWWSKQRKQRAHPLEVAQRHGATAAVERHAGPHGCVPLFHHGIKWRRRGRVHRRRCCCVTRVSFNPPFAHGHIPLYIRRWRQRGRRRRRRKWWLSVRACRRSRARWPLPCRSYLHAVLSPHTINVHIVHSHDRIPHLHTRAKRNHR